MSLSSQFMQELRASRWPLMDAPAALERLRAALTPEEIAEAIILIAQQEEVAGRERTKLHALVPPGWFREYLAFAQASEAPDTFHLFSALAVFSHLVGRRAWFRLGMRALYAPISVFLVSPAGAARRSSAIRVASDIGTDADAEVMQDAMTPEGLIDSLSSNPQTLIVADEAATLLSRSDYMATMPQVLCPLLDCPKLFSRKLRGSSYMIKEPTVNALIGCAPEWLLTSMPRSALGGGLFSRMLLVYEPGRKRLIALPDDEIDGKLVEDMALMLGRKAKEIVGGVLQARLVYDEDAKRRFREWYVENDTALKAADEKMAVYLSRKPDHAHRIVMNLLLASDTQGPIRDWLLTADTLILETALAILAYIEEGMQNIYQFSGINDKAGEDKIRVLRFIEKARKISHSELMRKTGM